MPDEVQEYKENKMGVMPCKPTFGHHRSADDLIHVGSSLIQRGRQYLCGQNQ